MRRPRVVVLTSCTGVKAAYEGAALDCADFARGRRHVARRHRGDLAAALVPAEDLYRGQQHLRLMRGVHAARESRTIDIDLRIVSAGYGVVAGADPLAPYECTFQGMSRAERRRWATRLQIPTAARSALAQRTDLAIVLLGDDYLDASGVARVPELGSPTLVFCGARTALRLAPLPGLSPVHLSKTHTRVFRCGLVGLKGEVGGRLLAYLAADPTRVNRLSADTLLDRLAAVGPVVPQSRAPGLALAPN